MPEGQGFINIPMAFVGRSCWRWHLGPNVPGVSDGFSWGTCGGESPIRGCSPAIVVINLRRIKAFARCHQ
jgi:hypothetical protein